MDGTSPHPFLRSVYIDRDPFGRYLQLTTYTNIWWPSPLPYCNPVNGKELVKYLLIGLDGLGGSPYLWWRARSRWLMSWRHHHPSPTFTSPRWSSVIIVIWEVLLSREFEKGIGTSMNVLYWRVQVRTLGRSTHKMGVPVKYSSPDSYFKWRRVIAIYVISEPYRC